MLEAVVHAICEVIERDAVSQLVFAERFADPETVESLCREVDVRSLPEAASPYALALSELSLGLRVHELETDVGVPTFRVFVEDDAYPSPEGPVRVDFAGYGTHPSANVALMRALTEAIQSRVGVVQGARDAFGLLQRGPQSMRSRPTRVRFPELHSRPAMDLREDLDFLLNRLSACGAPSVLAFDLTREDVGVPVVRIRVPGFSSYLVNQRRVDWRCLRHLVV
jgi:ribosomal protein S12 methylthiotransferase accessory factor